MKFKNTPQFRSWREKIKNKFTNSQKVRVKVCITGCRANGAIDVFKKFQEEAGKQNLTGKVEIVPTGCQKFCSGAPVVTIELPGVMYQSVSLEDVSSILDKTVKKQKVIPQLLGKQRKFLEAQKIRVLKNCGDINPLNLEEYIWKDGFSALEEVLSGMSPEEVIEEVKRS
ncbi:MAG TPA: NADH-quinone oxidoreductase subunit F, partial [Candidatus Omnitrophica bacterium]|nr:NADH-quinone oxidoreductase subunit F [Candidatus Omnitrophota bacterium]